MELKKIPQDLIQNRRIKTMTDTQAIADELYNTIQSTVEQAKLVDNGNGFDLNDVQNIVNLIQTVLTEVEKLSAEKLDTTLTGPEKKEVAVAVLTRFLSFDIPWVPNFLENKVKSYAVNFVIDYTVQLLNKKLGKTWFQ